MNKSELIDAIAKDANITKVAAKAALESFISNVTATLKQKDGKVSLVGFLTLEKKKRSARTARNPQTGATVKIPARNAVSVKVGSKLKEAVK